MFKPLALYIGLRYTRTKQRTKFISFITLISILGTALGITVLITVLSVMNGFEAELRKRILGMTAHVTITGNNGKLESWQQLANNIMGTSHIISSAPFIHGQVIISADNQVSGTLLRGINPTYEPKVSKVHKKMQTGKLSDLVSGKFGIILGSELAGHLGATNGDKITIVSAKISTTPIGILPRLKRFTVVGIFKIGMYEYDRNLAIVHIDDAAKLLSLNSAISGLRLKLDDLFNSPKVSKKLARKFYNQYSVNDWTKAHSNFFDAIKTEKLVMFVILLLIVAVATFNIVSTLVMVVAEKRGDIAILKTQGMSNVSVMAIFMVLGSIIGLAGIALGTLGGVLLALNIEVIIPAIESFFNAQFMSADVYYISNVPSKLRWTDVYFVSSISLGLSLLATLYPAWQASRINPAEVLRYE